MRVAIFSDLHLGFQEGKERENESFENAKQAFEISCEQKSDIILMAGDIFDVPEPSPETLLKGFEIFSIPMNQPKSNVKIKVHKKQGEKIPSFKGIPIITIHGTHEYRSIGHTNILELFDASNFLVYLKMEKALVELGNEKLCIHGFGGVPEKKSLDVLKLWNPKPLQDYSNVLVMHQSITEFLPFSDEMVATISLADLPKSFDLIINGHLHWTSKQELEDTTFLLTGSTVTTQMKKLEGEKPKGIYIFDTNKKSLEFFELPIQRKLFYHKIKFENATPREILQKAKELIEDAISKNEVLIPMVRLKFIGTLAKGINSSDVDLKEIKKEFETKAILSISKEFFSKSFKKKIAELRDLHASKQSISSIGLDLLEKNLEKTNFKKSFDVRAVFELLAENKIDEAIFLIQKQNES